MSALPRKSTGPSLCWDRRWVSSVGYHGETTTQNHGYHSHHVWLWSIVVSCKALVLLISSTRQLSSVNAAPRNPPRGLPSFSPLPLQFSHIQFSDSSEPAMLLYTAVFHPWLQLRPFSSRYSQRHKSLCFQSFRNSPEWHYFVSFLLTSFISDLTFSEVPFLSFLMILSGKEVDVFSVCSLDPISALFSKEALMSN